MRIKKKNYKTTNEINVTWYGNVRAVVIFINSVCIRITDLSRNSIRFVVHTLIIGIWHHNIMSSIIIYNNLIHTPKVVFDIIYKLNLGELISYSDHRTWVRTSCTDRVYNIRASTGRGVRKPVNAETREIEDPHGPSSRDDVSRFFSRRASSDLSRCADLFV